MKVHGFALWAVWVVATMTMACGVPNTYVLFATNARTDADMSRAITLRLPLENQPVGATIFCQAGTMRVSATKLDDSHIRVQDPDGEQRDLETPNDGIPIGLITFWPSNRAEQCGIDPASPISTYAYFMWGTYLLYMGLIAPHTINIRVGGSDQDLQLTFPITDSTKLRKYLVNDDLADLLLSSPHGVTRP